MTKTKRIGIKHRQHEQGKKPKRGKDSKCNILSIQTGHILHRIQTIHSTYTGCTHEADYSDNESERRGREEYHSTGTRGRLPTGRL